MNKPELHNSELITFDPPGMDAWAHQEPLLIEFIGDNYETILGHLRKEDSTIGEYQKAGRQFVAFIAANGLNIHTPTLFWKWLKDAKPEWSNSYRNICLTAAKHILSELYLTYRVLPVNLAERIELFGNSIEHRKEGLRPEEVERVKTYLDLHEDQYKAMRWKAMFALMAFQGLRQFEVTNALVEDFKPAEPSILIKGKRRANKEKILLFPATARILGQYVRAYDKRGFLFSSESDINTKDTGQGVTTAALRKIFNHPTRGIFARCGVQGRTVHGLRHFFITAVCEYSNGNAHDILKLSRLKTMEMVKVYLDEWQAKKRVEKFTDCFQWE